MQLITSAQASPEVPINENFALLGWAEVYGKNAATTTALTWGYNGGRWSGYTVTTGTLTLTNATINYIVVLRSTGVISTSTTSTNWDNSTLYARVYKITTAGSLVTVVEDHRAGSLGVHGTLSTIEAAYTNITQTYTAPQRGSITSDNDLSFDLNISNYFSCIPTAGGVLTFTNIATGQSGHILLTNNSNYAITAAATTKINATDLSTLSVTGVYILTYFSNGTNVYVHASPSLA